MPLLVFTASRLDRFNYLGLIGMQLYNLPLEGLPKEHKTLSVGQFWFFTEDQNDADRLTAGFLASLAPEQQASLICSKAKLHRLLSFLPVMPVAPIEVHTYKNSLPGKFSFFAQKHWSSPERLQRLLRKQAEIGVYVLRLSFKNSVLLCKHWEAQARLNRWLKEHNKALLVVVDGLDKTAIPLDSLAKMVQGCMFLERSSGGLSLDIFLWATHLGLYANLHYRMSWQANSLQSQADEQSISTTSSRLALDQREIVFQRASLLGLSLLSEHWSVQESYAAVLEQARKAQAATLVVALDSNAKVKQIAEDFWQLRKAGNNGLKLVVREVEPCLRHVDQNLLLLSGASFILPESTSNQQMLLFLSALQGLQWDRPLVDPESLAGNLEPQHIKGLVAAEVFFATVQSVIKSSFGEVAHQLLEFDINTNVAPQVLQTQLTLRRYGDIAAFVGDKFYLFLFACPDSALNHALHNIFKLPVSTLFTQVRKALDINDFVEGVRAQNLALAELAIPQQEETRFINKGLQPILLSAVEKELNHA